MNAPERMHGTRHLPAERRLQRRAALHGTALQDPRERRLGPPPEDGRFDDWPIGLIAGGAALLLLTWALWGLA